MYSYRIELTAGMSLEVTGDADLSIRGVDQPMLLVHVPKEGDAEVQTMADKVVVHLERDARVEVWRTAAVAVSQLGGDLAVEGLGGPLSAGQVEGDVALSNVQAVVLERVEGDVSISRAGDVQARGYINGDVALRQVAAAELAEIEGDLAVHEAASLSVERVDGDVAARAVAGPVRLNTVDGDLALREVGGAVEIGRVRGDLSAYDVRGGLMVTRVDDDVVLSMAFQEGQTYRVAAEGDISVRFPQETAARFVIQARRWFLPPAGSFQVETQAEDHAVVQLGKGGPEVQLYSDADVVLGAVSGDWERSFEQFSRRMDQWGEELRRRFERADWEHIGQEIEEATSRMVRVVESRVQELDVDELARRAHGMADQAAARVQEVDWERIGKKVEQAVQYSMHQVQAGLQRLQERLQKRAGRGPTEAVAVAPAEPTPPAVPTPSAEPGPVAEAGTAADWLTEERMAVLRLVEEGRLTAEEASALLDALEGF